MNHTYFSGNGSITGIERASEIKAINDVLQKKGHCALPDDYVDFLHEKNGMLSNSFTLFGTRPQELAQDGMEDDILDATSKAEEADIIGDNEVVLGRTSGGMLIIYSAENKHYHVTEESTGERVYDYLTLKGLKIDWGSKDEDADLDQGPAVDL